MKNFQFTKYFFVTLLSLVLLNTSAKAYNIAIIDVEKVLQKSKVTKDAQEQIAKKQDQYQLEIDKKQDILKIRESKLQSKKSLLSEEAFATENRNFSNDVEAFQKLAQARETALKNASINSISTINDQLVAIISEVSKEKNLDLIIPATQTLYYGTNLDVSDEVLKKLNAKITKILVKFE